MVEYSISKRKDLPSPCCILERRHIYSPKSTGNTQEAVASVVMYELLIRIRRAPPSGASVGVSVGS